MKNLDGLLSRIQADTLSLVTHRDGASVYKAQTTQGEVFVKAYTRKVDNDRYCEILDELTAFSLAPKVLNKFEWENYFVVVMSALEGQPVNNILKNCSRTEKISLLKSAGSTLGSFHRTINSSRLFEMRFWQARDSASKSPILWNEHLKLMISKWMSRVDPLKPDYQEFSYELSELLLYCKDLREPTQFSLLHCDYISRNILANSSNKISGVLDFEAARIGDAVYDLAKMVWVDIDFSDLELRNAFLRGWEMTYGDVVPQREFLCYVGIQCLAAIAWTDKNKPIEGNTIFRASAIRALRIVLNELRTGF
ncbi:aminoglycoside phosphotransferase family protein [Acinetobacter calcoaceticus]|uniref:Ser/Thr protein kinase RdoA (MazF antagonist) n=1 Tax=Acinetobacter calcoaceticus TaxID=471 RepID=A0ABD5ALB6_ACICA|nr:aminoglycoside phosphotransferase family protein [Acinetobacter calcoaceticus]MDP9803116.1 Ser/Thr protein kinase RdoA (MazF antagonist) [Acinetobacter calcoaceticus]